MTRFRALRLLLAVGFEDFNQASPVSGPLLVQTSPVRFAIGECQGFGLWCTGGDAQLRKEVFAPPFPFYNNG
jgi:hypothetical protein